MVPFLLLSTSNSILYKCHFYSSSTLKEACTGFLHSALALSPAENPSQRAAQSLLCRMVHYYHLVYLQEGYINNTQRFLHVPDVFTSFGVINLLSLCNVFEMINIVMYTVSDLDRHRFIEARRLCRRMVLWLEAHFIFTGDSGERLDLADDIWMTYLARQIKALVCLQDTLDQRRPASSLPDIKARVAATFNTHQVAIRLQRTADSMTDDFEWPSGHLFTITLRESPGVIPATPSPRSLVVQMPAVLSVLSLPSEILSDIFFWAICDYSPHVPHSSRTQALNLLSITHTSSTFRQVALNNPLLWSFVPFMNGVHQDFFEAMLNRASTIPFHLHVVENVDLIGHPNHHVWNLVVKKRCNIGALSIHVFQGLPGTIAKWLLSLRAPELRECITIFHDAQPIALDLQGFNSGRLFGDYAPYLERLELVNCHLPVDHARFPKLSTVSIRNTTTINPAQQHTLMRLEDLHLWQPSFYLLENLILFTVFDTPHALLDCRKLDLPVLRSLMIVANTAVCYHLATILLYPATCDCCVTIQLPRGRKATRLDAEAAAAAAALFVTREDKYARCWVVMQPRWHAIRFMKGTQLIILKFDFSSLEVTPGPPLALHLMSSNIPLPRSTPYLSHDFFLGKIWGKLADILGDAGILAGVTRLNLDFSPMEIYGPVTAYPLLHGMHNVRCIGTVESPHAWVNPLLPWSLVRGNAFPLLHTLVVRVAEEKPDKVARVNLSTFLYNRQLTYPLAKILFSVAPSFARELGYAFPDAIRICIHDIAYDFPNSVKLDYVVSSH
ncbi:hypothetical protein MD484_g8585, partial [Candolleomyces efflorescens]